MFSVIRQPSSLALFLLFCCAQRLVVVSAQQKIHNENDGRNSLHRIVEDTGAWVERRFGEGDNGGTGIEVFLMTFGSGVPPPN